KIIGEHGGRELSGKLKASARRILEMAELFEEEEPDIALSFSSPEMARVAFGLGIPHICVNDSPHAEAVARLTLPLSDMLLTSKFIPRTAWVKYGIRKDRIIQYRALDPWAWLKDFVPNDNVLKTLGLDASRPIITLRTEESFAAYLLGKALKESILSPTIDCLLNRARDVQVVIIPRYESQIETFKESFGGRAVVCSSVVDGPSLLSFTSIFVGAGGTMTAEAALLGVPTFSCYPSEPYFIERYLMRIGLVKRETDPQRLARKVLKTLEKIESEKIRQSMKAREIVKNFEDPAEVIAKAVNVFRQKE
ncbi:MAG: DUF354 domain-containing protein, partial [Nitrososphaerota archaeon]|nr:DUF354 domain-containing protein [Nitrososphaerota archaeon]